MKRKCLIIGYPGETGESGYCGGVLKDLQNYDNYLLSPLGGAWTRDEVIIKSNPTAEYITNYLKTISADEYFLFIFCGHGYYDEDKKNTIMQINHSEEISEGDIRGKYRSKLTILDCCRQSKQKMALREILMEAKSTTRRNLDAAECRKYYDERIVACENAIVKVYGCNIDEKAGDDSNFGGYYSSSLIESCVMIRDTSAIDLTSHFRIIPIDLAHDKASRIVKKMSEERQNPQIKMPREKQQLPFGVLA